MACQITSLIIVYSSVYSDADQRKHQSSTSLAFLRGIHQRPVNSKHIGPITRKMFPFDDVIMHKTRWETFKFCDLVHLILEIWQFISYVVHSMAACGLSPQVVTLIWKNSGKIWFLVWWEGKSFHFLVLGLEYSGGNRWILWWLMLLLLGVPAHQQPCYRLCKTTGSLPFLTTHFN